MGSLLTPASGQLSFDYITPRFGGANDLRSLCFIQGLTAPDVFPNDFYSKVFLALQEAGTRSNAGQTFSITTNTFGPWTVTDNQSWISLSPTSGTGIQNIDVTLPANSGAQRVGTITITQTLSGETTTSTVTQQAGVTETLTINPTSKNVVSGGETFQIVISTSGNPSWTVTDSASWISVTPTSGTGNGTLNVTVQNNTGNQRFGSVTVNWSGTNRTCAITQFSGGIQ